MLRIRFNFYSWTCDFGFRFWFWFPKIPLHLACSPGPNNNKCVIHLFIFSWLSSCTLRACAYLAFQYQSLFVCVDNVIAWHDWARAIRDFRFLTFFEFQLIIRLHRLSALHLTLSPAYGRERREAMGPDRARPRRKRKHFMYSIKCHNYGSRQTQDSHTHMIECWMSRDMKLISSVFADMLV